MSPPSLRRYRAERLLRKGFTELRAKVLAIVRSQLRAKGVVLDHADLEACYAQAFHGLYAAVLGGEHVESPSAWLVLVTFRRAIDESRATARRRAVGEAGLALHALSRDGRAVSDPDLAGALDDRVKLRQVFESLSSSLSAREREAASLCYLQGLTRAQAAERMGIGEARMRKLMEGAGPGRPGVSGKVSELLATIEAGEWCERQSSLMRAYAFGILDPDGARHAMAAAHLSECPACRAHVASLRGLAAVLPPLPLSLVLAGGGGAAAGAGAGSGGGGVGGAATVGAAGTSTAGIGVGGGLTAGVGPLAAKLAVVAAIVLGGGYAVLGGHARGAAPDHRTEVRPGGVSKPPAHVPTTLSNTHMRSRRAHRQLLRGSVRSTRKARPAASSYEFVPERTGARPTAPATAPQHSRGGAEFGFE